jgi:trimeric autotransporter adhesin
MNIKKTCCWLFALGLFCQGLVEAQTLPISYGTSPITFGVDANGLLSATGTFGGTDSLSLSGAGTRMFWDPYKAAFRAGYVNGTQWNDSNIGNYSVAMGYGTMASGANSVALGAGAATGPYSIALGGQASGNTAIAIGLDVQATGGSAIALGSDYTTASGSYSIAMGSFSTASGSNAIVMGYGVTASGNYATAAGYDTTANAYDSFVVGTYNVGLSETGATPSLTTWNATLNQADPLFEIGDGTYSTKSDALIVYKDGSAKFQGPVTVPQSGDIPMYTGNN